MFGFYRLHYPSPGRSKAGVPFHLFQKAYLARLHRLDPVGYPCYLDPDTQTDRHVQSQSSEERTLRHLHQIWDNSIGHSNHSLFEIFWFLFHRALWL